MGPLPIDDGATATVTTINVERAIDSISLVLHNLPNISDPPEIIGLLTVPYDVASPDMLGYHVADYLGFASLFVGVGRKDAQAWLTSVDTADLIRETGLSFACGNVGAIDGVTFGKKPANVSTFGIFDVIPEPEQLQARFLEEVKKRSATGAPLIIVVCGEVTPEQTIFFDGALQITTSKAELQKAIHPDCPVTLISLAPFSGGYQVNPFIGHNAPVDSKLLKVLLARHCGGALSDSILKKLTSRKNTPLLKDDERYLAAFDDLPMSNATDEQKMFYGLFHIAIRRALSRRLTRISGVHTFDWDIDHDEWPLGKRTGPPPDGLSFWKKKWDALETVPLDARQDGFAFLAGAFGGSKASQITHMKFMAQNELSTCPGDWNIQSNEAVRVALISFLEMRDIGAFPEEKCMDIFDLIEYRCSLMLLTDATMDILNLPRPDGLRCRDWDYVKFRENEKPGTLFTKMRTAAFGALVGRVIPKVPVGPGLYRDKERGIKFWRPAIYLSVAIATKLSAEGKDAKAAEDFANHDVYDVFYTIFQEQVKQVESNEDVMKLGKAWIKSLDLENAYAAAMSAVPSRVGIEISRHAPSPALESYAPYFGMKVPKPSVNQPQTTAAGNPSPTNGGDTQTPQDADIGKGSPVKAAHDILGVGGNEKNEAAITASKASPSPTMEPTAPPSPGVHGPRTGIEVTPHATPVEMKPLGKVDVQAKVADTKTDAGTGPRGAEKSSPIDLTASPKQAPAKSTPDEDGPAATDSDSVVDGTVDALIKQFPAFASMTKKETQDLIAFVQGRLQGTISAPPAKNATTPADEAKTALTQPESGAKTNNEASTGWQLSDESLPMTRADAALSHQRHAWAQSVKQEDAKISMQKDTGTSGHGGPKIVVNIPKIIENRGNVGGSSERVPLSASQNSVATQRGAAQGRTTAASMGVGENSRVSGRSVQAEAQKSAQTSAARYPPVKAEPLNASDIKW